jgi:hypothetical protein
MTNRDIDAHGAGQPGSTCHTVRDRLPAYLTAEALRQQLQAVDPDVATHLAGCASCRAELEELRELMTAAYTGTIEPAANYPQPDLVFLPARTTAPAAYQPWRFDEWGRLIISFSQALLDSLHRPALIGAARGQMLYSYTLAPQAAPNLDVSIEVFTADARRDLGFVRVNVEALDREPFAQEPSAVMLHAAGATWHGTTDETGCVAFESIPLAALPDLRIEITTGDDQTAD